MIDLVKQIQGGRADLLPALWDLIRGYAYKMALARYRSASGSGSLDRHGAEIQDYMQACFLGMIRALETYDPERASFLTWLTPYMQTEMAIAAGRRSQKQKQDPIHTAKRLEDPIDEDGTELQEIIPGGMDPADLAQKRIDNAGLRSRLEDLISMLPAIQAEEVKACYFNGKTAEQRSEETGLPISQIRSRLYRGIENLQGLMDRTRKGRELLAYLDSITPWTSYSSLQQFQDTGSSSVERLAVLREQRLSMLIKETQKTN